MQARDLSMVLAVASICTAGCELKPEPLPSADPSASTGTASGGAPASSSTTGVGGDGGAGGSIGGAGGAGGGADATFELLAWNLEQFPHASGAPAKVAEILMGIAPAVVAVQEIDDLGAFDALAASIPGYVATVASQGDGYVRVGMLHDDTRVEVTEVETLFPDDWYPFPRAPLKAHVSMKDGSFDFDLVVLHLKAQLDAESEARRRAACQALDAWAKARLAAGEDPDIVMAGDFNDEIDDPPQWNVFTAFLDAPQEYSFLTQAVVDAGDYSYIPFESLIDHVLVSSSVLGAYGRGTTEALHLEETVSGYVSDISDHRPVLSRFFGR